MYAGPITWPSPGPTFEMDVAAAEKDVRRSNPVKLNKTDKIMNVRIKINKKVFTDWFIS